MGIILCLWVYIKTIKPHFGLWGLIFIILIPKSMYFFAQYNMSNRCHTTRLWELIFGFLKPKLQTFFIYTKFMIDLFQFWVPSLGIRRITFFFGLEHSASNYKSIGIPIRDLCALKKWCAVKCCLFGLPYREFWWFGLPPVIEGLEMYSLGP
jgi:hypothetical protein